MSSKLPIFIFTGNSSLGEANYSEIYSNTVKLEYPCNNSYECSPYKATFLPGIYYFEVAGASGGSLGTNLGGKGGLTKGYYRFNHRTTAYIYIGGKGESFDGYTTERANGGFNGGGFGGDRGGGGGATDIRLKMGDNQAELESRFIVAGGGGAGHLDASTTGNGRNGGDGGGNEGGIGSCTDEWFPCYGSHDGPICPTVNDTSVTPGEFGKGIWGGGSGWWGGGSINGCGGGGGSGYQEPLISVYSLPRSTISGVHEGDGYAIISVVSTFGQTCKRALFPLPLRSLIVISILSS